ncbi:MAG: glycosyltransferase family 4 protein [Candidatus Helarchaeota archaeon]|nr:glycosyltransferase family 4 protein [Candidatus Helarchaeota archaeon]
MKSKPKIGFISAPIQFGGAERVDLNYFKHINRNKFDIFPILVTRPWEENENIFIKEIKALKFDFTTVPIAIRPKSQGRDYLRIIRCLRMIRSILKKDSFDLVHTNGYFADIVGFIAAKSLNIPIVSTCHGFISNDRKLKVYNFMDVQALRFFNRIISVSEKLKDDLVGKGVSPLRIVIIENAFGGNSNQELQIETRKTKRKLLNICDADFVLGYVGRVSEEKGINYLILASSMADRMDIPVKVIIIGEGTEKGKLEELAKRVGIEDKVIFAGFQSDVENWLSAMDVFVLPSLTEGTPMSLLEAMAYGIPCVASQVGGVPKIIDSGIDGILVPPGNAEEIKEAINILYRDEKVRSSISKKAKNKIVNKYNINEWIEKIESQYMEIIGAARN